MPLYSEHEGKFSRAASDFVGKSNSVDCCYIAADDPGVDLDPAPRRLPATELDSAPASVLAFSTKMAPKRVAVAVNILALDSYNALRRESRGGRYDLRPCDLVLTGVATDKLDIRGGV